jgi:hypothetical protein
MLVIDTSSLLSLVRYYLPFDSESILFNFVKNKIESGEIIIIDEVYRECEYVAKKIVVTSLPFLKSNQTKTTDCLPDKPFFHLVENDFRNRSIGKELTPTEFETQKNIFLNGADAKQVLFCKKNQNLLMLPRIVTEETEGSNDNKHFKKIPSLCKPIGITTISLPTLLQESQEIGLIFK